jgi:hypothetical protein
MNAIAPVTHALIDAVRRRITVLRIAESIATGCAMASVAGLALVPMLWSRGQSGLTMAEALLGLGCGCGLIWGFAARPTRLDAAAEADRQLGMDDLLGTVLLVCRDADLTATQWRQTLLAISEARCRRLRASAVIVNRLGMRMWGGIGVLVAGMLTLGLFSAQPPDLRASARLDLNTPSYETAQSAAQAADDHPAAVTSRPPGGGGADQDDNRNFAMDQASVDSSEPSLAAGQPNGNARPGNGDRGEGLGTARTNARSRLAFGPDGSRDAVGASAGPTAAGTGQPDAAAKGTGPSGDSVSPAAPAQRPAPPWQAPQWSADGAEAHDQIRSGRVPDSAADLVRDYFQRD